MGDKSAGEGRPPPSPLTGGYLLIVLSQSHFPQHKDNVLHNLTKGLITWDKEDCHVDLEKELDTITSQAPEGEEAKNGERLIQFASENLVTEVLIHPQLNTLVQCLRNLLSSFTRHRHIIHAGYTCAGNGAWMLQDGTYSFADFADMYQELEVQRVLRAYENTVTVDVHCCQEGDWNNLRGKDPFSKLSRVRLNPNDKLSASKSIHGFVDYLRQHVKSATLEELLESSEVVGNIRFSHPTLYVFPGGQGDAALFGINGFNMLVDGGFARKACFWDFTRHLDRLDAVLMTRINNGNVLGLSSLLQRKKVEQVYPQIGHFFCNFQERKHLLSPDGDKDKDPLLINLIDYGHEMMSNLRLLQLKPQACFRETSMDPINLYHKVGHGKLDMYVLSPAKDSREVRDFMVKWNTMDSKIFCSYNRRGGEFNFPLCNRASICALLVWQPANPEDNITRILFPGSTPQHKIFEGLDRLKNLEFMKHAVCSAKTLSPSPSSVGLNIRSLSRTKAPAIIDKIPENEMKQGKGVEAVKSVVKVSATADKIQKTQPAKTAKPKQVDKPKDKIKTDVEMKPETVKNDTIKQTEAVQKVEKPKEKPKKLMQKPSAEKKAIIEKKVTEKKGELIKSSPTTPKKIAENKLTEAAPKTEPKSRSSTRTKPSPSATPAKSAKEANNRKVLEQKTKESSRTQKPPVKKDDAKKTEKAPAPKKSTSSPSKAGKPSSPVKVSRPPVKKQEPKKVAKPDKEVPTDSAVSTPSTADADKAKDIAEKETVPTEVIETVEEKEDKPSTISSKEEEEDILIVEKVEIDIAQEAVTVEVLNAVEEQEETAKEAEAAVSDLEVKPLTKEELLDVQQSTGGDTSKSKVEALKTESQETSAGIKDLPSEKITPPKEKDLKEKSNEIIEQRNQADESQPDEKFSTTVESGQTTTAPTLPEDERIPLDEVKEGVEEKHIKEDTKEKESAAAPKPDQPKSLPEVPMISSGIIFDQRAQLLKDIVKTPDEVADLPVHEEADGGFYEGGGVVRKELAESKEDLLEIPSKKRPQDQLEGMEAEELKFVKDGFEKEDKSKDLKEDTNVDVQPKADIAKEPEAPSEKEEDNQENKEQTDTAQDQEAARKPSIAGGDEIAAEEEKSKPKKEEEEHQEEKEEVKEDLEAKIKGDLDVKEKDESLTQLEKQDEEKITKDEVESTSAKETKEELADDDDEKDEIAAETKLPKDILKYEATLLDDDGDEVDDNKDMETEKELETTEEKFISDSKEKEIDEGVEESDSKAQHDITNEALKDIAPSDDKPVEETMEEVEKKDVGKSEGDQIVPKAVDEIVEPSEKDVSKDSVESKISDKEQKKEEEIEKDIEDSNEKLTKELSEKTTTLEAEQSATHDEKSSTIEPFELEEPKAVKEEKQKEVLTETKIIEDLTVIKQAVVDEQVDQDIAVGDNEGLSDKRPQESPIKAEILEKDDYSKPKDDKPKEEPKPKAEPKPEKVEKKEEKSIFGFLSKTASDIKGKITERFSDKDEAKVSEPERKSSVSKVDVEKLDIKSEESSSKKSSVGELENVDELSKEAQEWASITDKITTELHVVERLKEEAKPIVEDAAEKIESKLDEVYATQSQTQDIKEEIDNELENQKEIETNVKPILEPELSQVAKEPEIAVYEETSKELEEEILRKASTASLLKEEDITLPDKEVYDIMQTKDGIISEIDPTEIKESLPGTVIEPTKSDIWKEQASSKTATPTPPKDDSKKSSVGDITVISDKPNGESTAITPSQISPTLLLKDKESSSISPTKRETELASVSPAGKSPSPEVQLNGQAVKAKIDNEPEESKEKSPKDSPALLKKEDDSHFDISEDSPADIYKKDSLVSLVDTKSETSREVSPIPNESKMTLDSDKFEDKETLKKELESMGVSPLQTRLDSEIKQDDSSSKTDITVPVEEKVESRKESIAEAFPAPPRDDENKDEPEKPDDSKEKPKEEPDAAESSDLKTKSKTTTPGESPIPTVNGIQDDDKARSHASTPGIPASTKDVNEKDTIGEATSSKASSRQPSPLPAQGGDSKPPTPERLSPENKSDKPHDTLASPVPDKLTDSRTGSPAKGSPIPPQNGKKEVSPEKLSPEPLIEARPSPGRVSPAPPKMEGIKEESIESKTTTPGQTSPTLSIDDKDEKPSPNKLDSKGPSPILSKGEEKDSKPTTPIPSKDDDKKVNSKSPSPVPKKELTKETVIPSSESPKVEETKDSKTPSPIPPPVKAEPSAVEKSASPIPAKVDLVNESITQDAKELGTKSPPLLKEDEDEQVHIKSPSPSLIIETVEPKPTSPVPSTGNEQTIDSKSASPISSKIEGSKDSKSPSPVPLKVDEPKAETPVPPNTSKTEIDSKAVSPVPHGETTDSKTVSPTLEGLKDSKSVSPAPSQPDEHKSTSPVIQAQEGHKDSTTPSPKPVDSKGPSPSELKIEPGDSKSASPVPPKHEGSKSASPTPSKPDDSKTPSPVPSKLEDSLIVKSSSPESSRQADSKSTSPAPSKQEDSKLLSPTPSVESTSPAPLVQEDSKTGSPAPTKEDESKEQLGSKSPEQLIESEESKSDEAVTSKLDGPKEASKSPSPTPTKAESKPSSPVSAIADPKGPADSSSTSPIPPQTDKKESKGSLSTTPVPPVDESKDLETQSISPTPKKLESVSSSPIPSKESDIKEDSKSITPTPKFEESVDAKAASPIPSKPKEDSIPPSPVPPKDEIEKRLSLSGSLTSTPIQASLTPSEPELQQRKIDDPKESPIPSEPELKQQKITDLKEGLLGDSIESSPRQLSPLPSKDIENGYVSEETVEDTSMENLKQTSEISHTTKISDEIVTSRLEATTDIITDISINEKELEREKDDVKVTDILSSAERMASSLQSTTESVIVSDKIYSEQIDITSIEKKGEEKLFELTENISEKQSHLEETTSVAKDSVTSKDESEIKLLEDKLSKEVAQTKEEAENVVKGIIASEPKVCSSIGNVTEMKTDLEDGKEKKETDKEITKTSEEISKSLKEESSSQKIEVTESSVKDITSTFLSREAQEYTIGKVTSEEPSKIEPKVVEQSEEIVKDILQKGTEILKDQVAESQPQPPTESVVSSTIAALKKEFPRSATPSDAASEKEFDLGRSTPRSDISSGQASHAITHGWGPVEGPESRNYDSDEDIPSSPMSITSHIHSPPQFDYELSSKDSMMTGSIYGALPEEEDDLPRPVKPSMDPMYTSMYISKYEDDLTLDKDSALRTTEPSSISGTSTKPQDTKVEPQSSASTEKPKEEKKEDKDSKDLKDPIAKWDKPLGLPPPTSMHSRQFNYWNPYKEWGQPLGLPSPAPPPREDTDVEVDTSGSAKTTPKKVAKMNAENNKLSLNTTIGKEANNKTKRSESPVKRIQNKDSRRSGSNPIYMDLSYVPHHGNSHYANVEFFKRIRARYYVFSGTEPSKDVFNALLEAKQTWEDKDLEVTIIPTYDTDTLGYWIAENEETLSKYKIDLSPSASRCTINLQDHDTSCSAYRLEF